MARDLAHRLRALIVILAVALGLAGQAVVGAADQSAETQTPGQDDAGLATLKSTQLATMLQNKNFFFVNVHIPYEGEIRNTDAFIPFDQIADNLDKLPSDKGAGIVLYCRSGRMSEIAGKELSQLGYTQVSHLSGGMIDWKKSGYEIIEK
jgi:rhodanese-related sulfurtransferase